MTHSQFIGSHAISATTMFLASVALPTATIAQHNYFLPHGVQSWSVPGNWSLGHCPLPGEFVYIEVTDASDKSVEYDWPGASDFDTLFIDGDGGFSGILNHSDHTLTTNTLAMSENGDVYYNLEDTGYLVIPNYAHVGHAGSDTAYFTLNTNPDPDAGLQVSETLHVGYNGAGEFDHRSGFAEIDTGLYVGNFNSGTYTLSGTSAFSQLTLNGLFMLGNHAVGTFEQIGGTFEHPSIHGFTIGLNTGGVGTYNMRGGILNTNDISMSWSGAAYFNHTGGVITLVEDLVVGIAPSYTGQTIYKMEDTDGTPELYVGGDIRIGNTTWGTFEQLSGGIVEVTGRIQIWKGTDTDDFSYLELGYDAGSMSADIHILNFSGYIYQNGGILTTPVFQNDSTYGITIRGIGDLQTTTLVHNDGTFYLLDNANLRGLNLGAGGYQLCNFVNNALFQMGTPVYDGGTFFGILTNHSLFRYYQGDFTDSKLINYDNVELYADFSCMQIVNEASFTVESDRWIYATGANAPNSVENNDNFTMEARSHVDVVTGKPFVNNGAMYAGGPGADFAQIHGDLENHSYLLPSDSALPSGHLSIVDNFTQTSGAELRIRIHGTGSSDYDRMSIQGLATLDGELDVRLTDGFVPSLGDTFSIISWGGYVGQFDPINLPDLPAGLDWEVDPNGQFLRLHVVEAACPADLTGDDQVNIDDIFAVLGLWGDCPDPCPPYCTGDLTEDCTVNIDDIFAILGQWGPCD